MPIPQYAAFTSTYTSPVAGPLTVNFTDTSGVGTVTTWYWTFGDGATSTVKNPSHTYSNPGTYFVVLYSNPGGIASTSTALMIIVTGDCGAPLFTETWAGGDMSGYSLLTGSAGVFTTSTGPSTYGYYFQHGGASTPTAIVQRTITPVTINRYDLKFYIQSAGSFGSSYVSLLKSTYSGPLFQPRANSANDFSQRALLNTGAGAQYFGLSALATGTWYQLSVHYVVGANYATITNIATGVVFATINFGGTFADVPVNYLRFVQANSSNGSGIRYSDLELFECPTAKFPSYTVTPTATFEGQAAVFTNTSTPAGQVNQSWYFGDGTQSYNNPGPVSHTTNKRPASYWSYGTTLQVTWPGDIKNTTQSDQVSVRVPNVELIATSGVTTGRRYFEVVLDNITQEFAAGIVIGRDDSQVHSKMEQGSLVSDRWIGFGAPGTVNRTNFQAELYTNLSYTITGTDFDYTGWNLVNGDILGFIVNMDAGTLESVTKNGITMTVVPINPTAYATINSWAPGTNVRPMVNAVSAATLIGGVTTVTKAAGFTLRTAATDISFLPPNCQPWDGSVPLPSGYIESANVIDLPMAGTTDTEWASITGKDASAVFPTCYYDDGDYPLRTVSIWPVPTQTGVITAWLWQPLVNVSSLDDEITLPPGYERALKFCLAVEIAAELGKEVPGQVGVIAKEAAAKIKRLNAEAPRLDFSEGLNGGKPFNWITGGFVDFRKRSNGRN